MKISKKTLANGLRVITAPMKDNPTVTVLVLVEAGSKYESARENGISHFLEHMCWKGTENHPGPVDISRELDSMGSSYNAFTSHEHTGYYAKADARHFKKIFSIVSDVYLHPIFPEGEIEKEKGVHIDTLKKGFGFDTQTQKVVHMLQAGIIDPTDVVINAIKSAIGVAASILTMETVITLPHDEDLRRMPSM